MPTPTPVLLTDRAGTPVVHTYIPTFRDNGVVTFAERDGVPIGDNKLTISLKKTQAGRYNFTAKLVLPQTVTQTVNSVDSEVVTRVAYADIRLSFDASSTSQERDDAIGLITSALDPAQSEMIAVSRDLESFY